MSEKILEVGDEIMMLRRGNPSGKLTIERTTAKRAWTNNGVQFVRQIGYNDRIKVVGESTYSSTSYMLTSDEIEKEYEERKERNNLVNVFSSARHDKLTTDQLRRISQIINEPTTQQP